MINIFNIIKDENIFLPILSVSVNIILMIATVIYARTAKKQLKSSEKRSIEMSKDVRVTNCFSKIYFFEKQSLFLKEKLTKKKEDLVDNVLCMEGIEDNHYYLRFRFTIYDKNNMPLKSIKVTKIQIKNAKNDKSFINKDNLEYSDIITSYETNEISMNYTFACILNTNEEQIKQIRNLKNFRIILNLHIRNSLNVELQGEFTIVLSEKINKKGKSTYYKVDKQYHRYDIIKYEETN